MVQLPCKDTHMPKLSDIQTILLSTASQRPDGNLLPLPNSLDGAGARIDKSIALLLKRGFVAEDEVTAPDRTWPEEDERRIGLVTTEAGREAIGVEPAQAYHKEKESAAAGTADQRPYNEGGDEAGAEPTRPPAAAPVTARAGTKQAILLDLLRRNGGATITDLAEATGWLPHTTRAALTGFRKRGLVISKEKVEGVTRYILPAGDRA